MDKDSVQKWELLQQEKLADFSVFDVVVRKFSHNLRAKSGDFFVIRPRDWVLVLAVTEQKKCVLVSQFRFGSQELSLEFPGGCIDEGEDVLLAGQRELVEETGYSGEAEYISWCHPNPAIQDNKCHFIIVKNAKLTNEVSWDEHEELAVELYDVSELESLVREGKITHSMAIAALVHAKPYLSDLDRV